MQPAIESFPTADNVANLQLDAIGNLRHLLTLKDLSGEATSRSQSMGRR